MIWNILSYPHPSSWAAGTGASVADHHVHAAEVLGLRGFGHELREVGTCGMWKNRGKLMGISPKIRLSLVSPRKKIGFSARKMCGIELDFTIHVVQYVQWTINIMDLTKTKNSDISWGYKKTCDLTIGKKKNIKYGV